MLWCKSNYCCVFFFFFHFVHKLKFPRSLCPAADVHTMQHNHQSTLICKLTDSTGSSHNSLNCRLKRISWFKNGEPLESVSNPNPSDPKDSPRPLGLKSLGVEDKVIITSFLLRAAKPAPYEISDHTVVHSKY